MEWADDTIIRLRELWSEGHSTAEIGRRLGVSKNAVVGKAHRLDLPPRPSPIRREPDHEVRAEEHDAGRGHQADLGARPRQLHQLGIDRVPGDRRARLVDGRCRFGHGSGDRHPTAGIDTTPPDPVATKMPSSYGWMCPPTTA